VSFVRDLLAAVPESTVAEVAHQVRTLPLSGWAQLPDADVVAAIDAARAPARPTSRPAPYEDKAVAVPVPVPMPAPAPASVSVRASAPVFVPAAKAPAPRGSAASSRVPMRAAAATTTATATAPVGARPAPAPVPMSAPVPTSASVSAARVVAVLPLSAFDSAGPTAAARARVPAPARAPKPISFGTMPAVAPVAPPPALAGTREPVRHTPVPARVPVPVSAPTGTPFAAYWPEADALARLDRDDTTVQGVLVNDGNAGAVTLSVSRTVAPQLRTKYVAAVRESGAGKGGPLRFPVLTLTARNRAFAGDKCIAQIDWDTRPVRNSPLY
jgi:hypothetical protein